MIIPISYEGLPYFIGALAVFICVGLVFRIFSFKKIAVACYVLALVSACCMLYFFRDPARVSPNDLSAVLAGADGTVTGIETVQENRFLNTETVRISIWLSLFDVHINRNPMSGKVSFLGYFPGSHYFTIQPKSSELNHHSSIVIEGEKTSCLVNQIVGPIVKRVVYWLNLNQYVTAGERFGMMKFGSRLDTYLPKSDVIVTVKVGQKVTAGETIIATIKTKD